MTARAPAGLRRRVDALPAFRSAGRALISLGLVNGTEGNLSTFDGETLTITRTGCRLDHLSTSDVLIASLGEPPPDASSDLEVHVRTYRERGPGALAHAHPAGTVPEGAARAGEHGVYAFGASLEDAVREAVRAARDRAATNRPVAWLGDRLRLLDQTRLPWEERWLVATDAEAVATAIRRLAVRGAPLLGITASYGMALAAVASRAPGARSLVRDLQRAGRTLCASRPTAVNVSWAVGRALRAGTEAVKERSGEGPGGVREAVLAEAIRIDEEERRSCLAIGRFGAALVPAGANVLTHCNTGALATGWSGTAQGIITAAHEAGAGLHVWVDETRPLLQGARLTAWELGRLGIPMTLVADAAAASLMASGRVDLVIVGADRIAANGDVANKVGTYGLAVLAHHHRIPFYVAAPVSTVDLATETGGGIVIEERDPGEVTAPLGSAFAPDGTPAANPAFDLTPARLVTAIVTDRGVVRPAYPAGLRRVLRAGAAEG